MAARLIGSGVLMAYAAAEEGPSGGRQVAAPHVALRSAEPAICLNTGDGRFPKVDVYDAAAATIARAAADGKQVTVLCEGDPFSYGSLKYLSARLPDRCRVEVVPGV